MSALLNKFKINSQEFYRFQSITAECLNNTRMTLKRLNKTINYNEFENAMKNLKMNWDMYLTESLINVNQSMSQWMREANLRNLSINDFKNQRNYYEDEYGKENFVEYIQENITEFEDLGFELSVEWVKNE